MATGLNRDDFNRNDLRVGDFLSEGLKPPNGSPTVAAEWYKEALSITALEGCYDFRGKADGSTLTLDANSAVSTVEDLSDQGNDATHWRGTGTHVQKALLRIDDSGVQGIDCWGKESADAKHWGFHNSTVLGATATAWHVFTVFTVQSTATFRGAGASGGGSSSAGYGFPYSALTNGRPYFGCASKGGLDAGDWETVVSGAGGQMSDAGGTTVNLESLVGRGSEEVCLAEFRLDGSDVQEVWMNGLMLNDLDPGIANDNLGYMFWGMRSIASSTYPQHVYAIGLSTQSHPSGLITTAQAATIRAAIMADFGISVWDGSTYP